MTFIHQPTEFEKQKNDKDFIERLKLFCKNQLEEKPKIMSKQTAVEWYEIEINLLIEKYEAKEISQTEFLIMKHNLFYPARKMEDQQLIDAHTKGYIIGGGNGDLYDCKTFNK